ncbi:DKNYY domain-containing protein [Candidatus Uhrbacteria bacterium]|nr:DKNYY domain-containing protein [Candidatus Uhrbacteria bacterium]
MNNLPNKIGRLLTAVITITLLELPAFSEYVLKHGRIYYKQTDYVPLIGVAYQKIYTPIDADVKSFTRIPKFGKYYARDANKVFFEGNIIKGADPATFTHISGRFWIDKNHVFMQSSIVEGANPATFKVIDEKLEWGMDDKDVYFLSVPIGADAASFRILRPHWAKDNNYYYSDHGLIFDYKIKSDYNTFKILNESYATDINHAYYGGQRIDGADTETFEALNDVRARDANWYYLFGDRQRTVQQENEFNQRKNKKFWK